MNFFQAEVISLGNKVWILLQGKLTPSLLYKRWQQALLLPKGWVLAPAIRARRATTPTLSKQCSGYKPLMS